MSDKITVIITDPSTKVEKLTVGEYIANQLAAKDAEIKRLREVLELYANHEKWMAEPADGVDECCIFDCGGNGWEVAEDALKSGVE